MTPNWLQFSFIKLLEIWQLWANNEFNLYNNFISGTCSKLFCGLFHWVTVRQSALRLRFDSCFDANRNKMQIEIAISVRVVKANVKLTRMRSLRAQLYKMYRATF